MKNSLDSKIRITWFIPNQVLPRVLHWLRSSTFNPNHVLPSVWIRAFQLTRYLEAQNFQINFNTINPQPDIAIFLRRYTSTDAKLMQRLKKNGTRTILDVVANYFHTRESFPEGYGGATKLVVSDFIKMAETADQVWTVSPYLLDQALLINPESYFVPDSVDPDHFNPQRYSRIGLNDPQILGWSGSTEKASELNEISSFLKELIEANQIQVMVITRKRPQLNFNFQFRIWNFNTFPGLISRCSICIAPRRIRNEYDLGHSFFKIGVFMSMGIPALAGPVPSYALLLDDGKAGAICSSTEDWKIHIRHLIQDEDARLLAGRMAQEKMKPYMTPSVVTQITGLFQRLLLK